MSWESILRAVEDLARGPEPNQGRWTEILGTLRESGLFREVDVRIAAHAGIVVLSLDPTADLESCAAAVKSLGPPVDISVVSPPVRDPRGPDRTSGWDRKHGVCHDIGDRRVWFGLETTGDVRRLVSISIHYDGSSLTEADG